MVSPTFTGHRTLHNTAVARADKQHVAFPADFLFLHEQAVREENEAAEAGSSGAMAPNKVSTPDARHRALAAIIIAWKINEVLNCVHRVSHGVLES